MAPDRNDLPDDLSPSCAALAEYWRSIHPDGGLPGRRHFDPTDIPRLLPSLWLLDVDRDPLRFRIRLVGTRLTEFAGRDSTGHWLDDVQTNFDAGPIMEVLSRVVNQGRPGWQRADSQSRPDKTWVVLESIYFPLAADGKHVDRILCLTDILPVD
ncbi:MAG: PAS domain-containing protein [Alphaproteobacteria bacterium]|jgi:hypothetical protein|nr:PAS domain-containing protein [Alphaproteobacteria bacterium]